MSPYRGLSQRASLRVRAKTEVRGPAAPRAAPRTRTSRRPAFGRRIETDRHARPRTARVSAHGPRTMYAHPRPARLAEGRSDGRTDTGAGAAMYDAAGFEPSSCRPQNPQSSGIGARPRRMERRAQLGGIDAGHG